MGRQFIEIGGFRIGVDNETFRNRIVDAVSKMRADYGEHQLIVKLRFDQNFYGASDVLTVSVQCPGCVSVRLLNAVPIGFDLQNLSDIVLRMLTTANREFREKFPPACADAMAIHIAAGVLES